MPVYRQPEGLVIINPIFGDEAVRTDLIGMSREMFYWLDAYNIANSAPNPEMQQNLLNRIKREVNPISLRSHFAATRCYKLPLASVGRDLTPYGARVAEQVHDIKIACKNTSSTSTLYNANTQDSQNPQSSQGEIEHMMINAEITWRAVYLLQVLDLAISRAVKKFYAKMAQSYIQDSQQQDVSDIPESDLLTSDTTNTQQQQEYQMDLEELEGITIIPNPIDHSANTESGTVSHDLLTSDTAQVMTSEFALNYIRQLNSGIIGSGVIEQSDRKYYVEDMKPLIVRSPADEIITYVTVASLGVGKARTDWRSLARYGLLDVRTIRDGTRGRAKLALMINENGKNFLSELVDKGWLAS